MRHLRARLQLTSRLQPSLVPRSCEQFVFDASLRSIWSGPGKTPIGVMKEVACGRDARGLAQLPSILSYAVFSCAPAIRS
ncbi:hypothetical protein DPM13_15920 [Paracoccus mutanolyticus]|uniref:Uncharacterized protein n=1 Tax=Paracoccus mutanolyticus TaxID=1499308 RepID=A0ABN5MBA9_9RHOB|nr:hypothetical protein DPM13_15920 [Paracoccus mutanolyticus]